MTPATVTAAGPGDAHHAAAVIAAAFRTLDVAAWLVPDVEDRQMVLYANFRIIVDHAVDHGHVLITEDRAAAAVWLPHDAPEITDYRRRLEQTCGRYAGRLQALDAAFAAHHPDRPHHHLALLAVQPGRQGAGIGTALLDRYHHCLDANDMPAYLEASSGRSRALYTRHGYLDHGTPIQLPDGGPKLWPMWRPPLTRGSPD